MQRRKKMTLVYLAVAYILITIIAIALFITIKPKKSAASKGQETAQSLTSDIEHLKEYRSRLSVSNTVLLFLAALSATLLVVASRLSDESADELSEMQSKVGNLKEEEFAQDLRDKELKITQAKTLADSTRTELELEKRRTAIAQKETAEAQLALRKNIEDVARHSGRRALDIKAFLEPLKNKPKANVDLQYKENDSEAYMFALQIRRWLGPGAENDGAGWNVTEPHPFKTDIGLGGSGSNSGITVIAGDIADELRKNGALNGLTSVIGFGLSGTSLVTQEDRHLPPNTFILLIGQKP